MVYKNMHVYKQTTAVKNHLSWKSMSLFSKGFYRLHQLQ